MDIKHPTNQELTQESRDALASLINMGSNEVDIYNRFAGSGVGVKRAAAISIQDLVKSLNTGSGLRLA
ncbi:hypothetical protein DPMN_100114 [Dreissena polymorpha]|uniref:Uncharacterized protein n=1 Tax=Dreissena polymorpha TaxID=45954 RepID=A0A9D4R8U2_DREPO|nr:hypothetical protein DPMN_100114 [Dreissena polymorpha]